MGGPHSSQTLISKFNFLALFLSSDMFPQLPHLLLLFVFHQHEHVHVQANSCGDFTTRDTAGPYFVDNVPKSSYIAPDSEREDSSQGVFLWGHIWNRDCAGISGATVEVWYAGGSSADY